MKVFLAGADGFLGRALARALEARGHRVVCGVRTPAARASHAPCATRVAVDFGVDLEPESWLGRLRGMDAVINAVGIIDERGGRSFRTIHTDAPIALFTAAVAAGVRRIVQVSALGADAGATSRYHLSKKAADDALSTLPVDWVIVLPSLVFGPGGESARLFTMLASLPWIPVPGRGDYRVQPIHRDDCVDAIVRLLEWPDAQRLRVPLVGPEALRFEDFLKAIRSSLGLPPARVLHVPAPLVALGSRLLSPWCRGLPTRETLGMLYRGSAASPAATRDLLGRAPRAPADFVPRESAAGERSAGQLRWLLPVLRASIALVWIATGVISLGIYPAERSLALLARAGVPPASAPLALYGAAVLDLALGLLSLAPRRPAWLWPLQMSVIAFYTIVISVKLPEYWMHPYGPVLKNLPMLAAIWAVHVLERRPSNT